MKSYFFIFRNGQISPGHELRYLAYEVMTICLLCGVAVFLNYVSLDIEKRVLSFFFPEIQIENSDKP